MDLYDHRVRATGGTRRTVGDANMANARVALRRPATRVAGMDSMDGQTLQGTRSIDGASPPVPLGVCGADVSSSCVRAVADGGDVLDGYPTAVAPPHDLHYTHAPIAVVRSLSDVSAREPRYTGMPVVQAETRCEGFACSRRDRTTMGRRHSGRPPRDAISATMLRPRGAGHDDRE